MISLSFPFTGSDSAGAFFSQAPLLRLTSFVLLYRDRTLFFPSKRQLLVHSR